MSAAAAFCSTYAPFGTRNRHDVITLRQDPREGQLCGSDALFRRDCFEHVDETEVGGEVVALETWTRSAKVACFDVVGAGEPPGKKAAAQGRVRDEAHAELATRRQNGVLRIARPQRVFALHGCDRMHRVRATNRFGRGLTQSDVAHLVRGDSSAMAPTVSSIGTFGSTRC